MKILILSQDQTKALLPMRECIEVMADTLAALQRGEAHQPLRTAMVPPRAPGVMALMPSYRYGENPVYGLKIVCVTADNPTKGLDSHQGGVMLFEAETGRL